MEGEVYPNNLRTTYWFEYGARGASELKKTSTAEAGSDGTWHPKHALYESLEPCHSYEFRVVAENEDSVNGPPKGPVYGELEYFETKCRPMVHGVKVSHLEPSSVVLEAEINPEEAETKYHFEYDTREYKQEEPSHGTSVPLPEPSAGSGTSFVKESVALVKLIPGQTYYFNVRTHNESGTVTAAGQFKTPVWWLLNGKSKLLTTIRAEGPVVVEQREAGVAAECSLKMEGSTSFGVGEITKVTGPSGEALVSCRAIKTKLLAGCGEPVKVEASGLPWHTELVDVPVTNEKSEVIRYEVRERFYGEGSTQPGLTLKCGSESKVWETCAGEFSGNTENVSAGVPIEVDGHSPKLACGGKSGNGVLEGALVFSSGEGTLSVYGAPKGPAAPAVSTGETKEVTSTSAVLTGTIGAKGAATTYQFEYGTSPTYGSKIPTSPTSAGEGRLRVEEHQTISSLKTGTLYHYRLVASNSAGTTYGEDKMVTPGYPASWQLNGKSKLLTTIRAEGPVVVEQREAGVAAECSLKMEGSTSFGVGEITKVTGPSGEALVSCRAIKTKLLAGCGEPVKVEASGLPWHTELVDVPVTNEKSEVIRYEVRERFYGEGSTQPGLTLKCGSESKVWETCAGEFSGNTENVSAGVPIEVDGHSPKLACGGKSGNGVLEGALVFSSGEGTLSVYGAPKGPAAPAVSTGETKEVTSTSAVLTGTIGAKGAATTYQFEYGTSPTYGSKIPTSPTSAGEGRLRVEEHQTISSLKTGTLYHYRLVASNSAGTTYGEDKMVTPGYPASWQLNGKSKLLTTIRAEGPVVVEQREAGVAAECSLKMEGSTSFGVGEITKVTGPSGEALVSCRAIKTKLLAGCGEPVKVEASGLPWHTELVDVPVTNEKSEVIRYEVRERFYGEGSTQPGLTLKCGSESKVWETCAGEFSGNTENVSAGVPIEVDGHSPKLACGGKSGNGVLEGALVFSSGEGTLSVYGAPKGPAAPAVSTGETKEVTSTSAVLTGTIGAKGAATTYQFEYGTSPTYGSKIPTSPTSAGEGRLRVEENQTISSLKTGTLYHYRLVASNSAGTTYGEDKMVTPGYPASWQLNGKSKLLTTIRAEGPVVVEQREAGVAAECSLKMEGSTSFGVGEITKVTGPSGEALVSCRAIKTKLLAGCGEPVKVEASGLPWHTELVDVPVTNEKSEVIRYEVRERFYGEGSTQPGLTLKCGSESKVWETCAGEFSGNTENVSAGVPIEVDGHSPKLACGGKSGNGVLEGAFVFSSGEGTLSVYGAPKGPAAPAVSTGETKEVTSTSAVLTGTIGAKGAATTYQFEYGTSPTYGSKIPTSPTSAGEGRLRVEENQTISSLKTGTLYHYRLVASNSAGTTYGEDKMVTPGYPASWQLNGKEALLKPVKAEGTLTIRDTGLEVAAECTVSESGLVAGSAGNIEAVTGAKGETLFSCHSIQTGWCGTATIEVEARYLPWTTELIDIPLENGKGEVTYEPRLRDFGTSTPGLTIKCAFMGSFATDLCTGEPSGNVKNVTSGVAVTFDSKSPTLTCIGSAIGTGTVEGTLTFTSTETAKTLSVYGAPGP